jgi:hypothetical protein
MRSAARIVVVLGLLVCYGWGCSGTKSALHAIPPSLLTLPALKNHVTRIAVLLTHTPETVIGREVGALYVTQLVEAMRKEDRHLQLVTAQDPELPVFFADLLRPGAQMPDAFDLAAAARSAGYQAWAIARIESIRTHEERTGILWFRRTKHIIFFDLTLAVYDAFTGAKLSDDVIESSTKISAEEFEAFQTGAWADLEDLREAITDQSADLGEKVAKTLERKRWCAAVVKVQDDRVFLASGSRVGMGAGDRLAVLDGQRTIQGQNGERFIVPGFEVGQIEIVHVADEMSEGKVLDQQGGNKIQSGDIAVPIK